MDIKQLSDEQLAEKLSEKGFQPGPILDSTRRVYQKKLQRLLQEDVPAEGAYASAQADELEYSSVDEEEDDLPDTVPIEELMPQSAQEYRSSPAQSRNLQTSNTYTTSYSTTTSDHYFGDTSQLSRRSIRDPPSGSSLFDPSSLVSQATPPPATEKDGKKGGLSLCAKLVFLLALALIVFLVFQHMEPPAANPLHNIEE